jgi:hypothetical protein
MVFYPKEGIALFQLEYCQYISMEGCWLVKPVYVATGWYENFDGE